jgi:hypothetical protein
MATEFFCTINKANAAEEDYSSLSSWEAALDEADLTSALNRVYDVASVTGTIDDGDNVDGQTGGYTAKVLHVNNANTSPRRVMVVHDTGSEEFANGEVLQKDGSNYITLADPCNSDTVKPVAECYKGGGTLADRVTINFAGTDATNYVRVTVPESDRHVGIAGTGFVLDPSASGHAIDATDTYTVIEWLEITGVSGDWQYGVRLNAYHCTVRYCILHTGAGAQGGVYVYWSWGDVHNNIIYKCGYIGIRSDWADYFNIYNNTVYSCGGYVDSSNIVLSNADSGNLHNNISVEPDGTGSCAVVDEDVTEDYNLVSDESLSNTHDLQNKAAADQFVSVTSGSEDLHLKSGADAIDAGTDFGTSPSGVEIDIDGWDRDTEQSTWDIGAHECLTGTAFISTISKTGQDYDKLSDWESAVLDGVDLFTTVTRVYDVSSVTGTVSDGDTVTGQTNSYQATVKHVNVSGTTPRRVMVVHDTIGEEFVNSEVLQKDGDNYITLANPCNSDMAIPTAELYGDDGELSDTVAIDNTTTGSANYIRIYAPDAERRTSSNPLRYGYGARVAGNTANGIIVIAEKYVRVEGIEVYNSDTSSTSAACIRITDPRSGDIRISDCVLKGGRYSIRLEDDCRVKVWETVTYGGGNGGVGWAGKSGSKSYFYNCTLIGTLYAVYEDAGIIDFSNCYGHGATECFVSCDGYKSYCACSDESLDDEGTYDNLQQNVAYSTSSGAYFTSITGGSEDYHIQSSSTLKDNGTDDPASGLYSKDIDRVTWTSPWDIGAVQYAGAPPVGVAVPILSKDGIHSLIFGGQVITG